MTHCNDITARSAGLVQQLNTVHVLCSQGAYKKANETLATVQAQMQVLSRDLWLEYNVSGEVK